MSNGVKVTIIDNEGMTEAVVSNGQNGYTPIKGVDYFDGQKGEAGYTPIKGKDYFTNEDKAEIEASVLDKVNQFSVAVVESLPVSDIDEHTIYFVPKDTEEENDVYDEFIYINRAWEHIGTTAVDLTGYVKDTDYATGSRAGVLKANNGLSVNSSGVVLCDTYSYDTYNATQNWKFISKGTLENVITGKDLATKQDIKDYVDSLNANSIEY